MLPLSDNPHIPASMGTRHRAALGLSEECDAAIIAVSEESGRISLAHGGKYLGRDYDEAALREELRQLMFERSNPVKREAVEFGLNSSDHAAGLKAMLRKKKGRDDSRP